MPITSLSTRHFNLSSGSALVANAPTAMASGGASAATISTVAGGPLATDAFTRANSATLGTATVGGAWTDAVGGVWSIVSNRAQSTTTGAWSPAWLATGQTDVDVTADFVFTAAIDLGLIARVTDANNLIFLDLSSGGAGELVGNIFRRQGGFTALGTLFSVTGLSAGSTHTARLKCSGTSIKAYIDGVQVCTGADAVIAGTGAGFARLGGTDVSIFDNLSVTVASNADVLAAASVATGTGAANRPNVPGLTVAVTPGTAGAAVRAYAPAVGSPASPATPPTAAFAVGTEVGVPTGTTLTATTGLPTQDATETLTLTHPVSGVVANRTVKVWRRRSWTSTLTLTPPTGETWLFDECQFTGSGAFWLVEVVDTNGVQDQMQPLVVFRRSTFDGSRTSERCLLGNCLWLIGCHLNRAGDGFQSAAVSVAIGCNIIADTGGGADEHSDGVQNAGFGMLTLYNNWISAGIGPGASQAVRVGVEFGDVTGVDVYYCGLDRGGWTLQVLGWEAGGRFVNAVRIVGNRWTRNSGFGPHDFADVNNLTWTDNAYVDGAVITGPGT